MKTYCGAFDISTNPSLKWGGNFKVIWNVLN